MSLLQDVGEHQQVVGEDSFLSRAQRHAKFFMSTMISPLQLLDFSQLATPQRRPPFSMPTSNSDAFDAEDDDSWQPRRAVASIDADGALEDEEAHRMQGDASHALRVSVGAHRPAAMVTPPALSPAAPEASAAVFTAAHVFTPLSWASASAEGGDGVGALLQCNSGQEILFRHLGSGVEANTSESLCFCPFDWQGERCDQRVSFRCPIRIVQPQTACNDIRSRPPSTSSTSLSAQEPAYSLSSSSSGFFRYQPVLSGSPPPCLSMSGPTTLHFNFTCSFLTDDVREGWGNPERYAELSVNYTQQEQVQPFNYTVLVTNPAGGPPLFALTQKDPQIRLDVIVHNTAHPSQSITVQRSLNSSHLQYSATQQAANVQWMLDPAALTKNFKRGGRILLTLLFVALPGGLQEGPSLLPWRLYVEDDTFRLPGAGRKALLTRLQWGVVVVLVTVVLALLVYRWWQKRQTDKFQQLMTEQRGKQKSWFEQSE